MLELVIGVGVASRRLALRGMLMGAGEAGKGVTAALGDLGGLGGLVARGERERSVTCSVGAPPWGPGGEKQGHAPSNGLPLSCQRLKSEPAT